MELPDIYVHDGKLLRVIEDVQQEKLTMEALLPADPWSEKLVSRRLIFEHVHGYEVFEGRVDGCPMMLDFSVVEMCGKWGRVRLDTNHGHRELYCTTVRVCDPETVA